jgi:hypothetical protein
VVGETGCEGGELGDEAAADAAGAFGSELERGSGASCVLEGRDEAGECGIGAIDIPMTATKTC